MEWIRFFAAALLGASVMQFAGAPFESVVAGVVLAGGLTCIQRRVLRKGGRSTDRR